MFIPDENVKAYGTVKNLQNELCLDTLQRNENKGTVILGIFSCQGGKGSEAQVSESHKFHPHLSISVFFIIQGR